LQAWKSRGKVKMLKVRESVSGLESELFVLLKVILMIFLGHAQIIISKI